jgi:transposase
LTNGEGTAKELTAYIGLDPRPYQSGQTLSRRAGISRMGNKMLRSYVYMGARGGVLGDNVLREFFQRLIGRGKAYKVALVAAARKILVWAWRVFQDDTEFDPALAASKMA